MSEYPDRVLKADKCAQYVDDIGIATQTAEEMKINLRLVFQCNREASLRLTMAKCQFGAKKVVFLGRTVSPEGIAPQSYKLRNYLQKLSFPKTKKGLQMYIGFVNYCRNEIPRLFFEKIAPFHELIKVNKPIKIDNDIINAFNSIKQSTGPRVRSVPETIAPQQAIRTHDRRELQECRLCPYDRGECRREPHASQKNVCSSRFRLKKLFTIPDQNAYPRQGIPGKICSFYGRQPHPMGIDQTGHCPDRQQVSDENL